MFAKKMFKINKLNAPDGARALEPSGPKVNGWLKNGSQKSCGALRDSERTNLTRIDAGELPEAGDWALWDISQFDRFVDQEQGFHLGMCKQRNIVSDLEREIGR